jgi:hypothetical protein
MRRKSALLAVAPPPAPAGYLREMLRSVPFDGVVEPVEYEGPEKGKKV